MYIKTLSVSGLNNYIKKIMDSDFILNNSNVKGEISNLKLHSSGHMYFSLKDAYSKINCVMFKSSVSNLNLMPENGMNVVVRGRISVYEKEGSYQLYCDSMELEGMGELFVAFEKLKGKLESEGLFLESHKRELPRFVKKVGVVTSPTGAAIQDIINVAKRRNKGVDILLYPARVQGLNSSSEIIKGIKYMNKTGVDVIILARGGGSIEELWAFNDEELAYAVFNSEIPVITGVGHETDFTIVDFVSDRRASTPSQACEIAVFDLNEMNGRICYIRGTLDKMAGKRLAESRSRVDLLRSRIEFSNPSVRIVNEYARIDDIRASLDRSIKLRLSREKDRLGTLNALLMANNPLKVLTKGYSIIEDENRNVICSVDDLRKKRMVNIIVKDGNVKAELKICE
ncbi:MAG: exodeoxyribonuclease large subunit [Firmicutes bacterium]|nr:exodeoxyribonuclease large subunit [Bacillota bacterium]